MKAHHMGTCYLFGVAGAKGSACLNEVKNGANHGFANIFDCGRLGDDYDLKVKKQEARQKKSEAAKKVKMEKTEKKTQKDLHAKEKQESAKKLKQEGAAKKAYAAKKREAAQKKLSPKPTPRPTPAKEKKVCTIHPGNKVCKNSAGARQSSMPQVQACESVCRDEKGCTGGYFETLSPKVMGTCYLYGVKGARARTCIGETQNKDAYSVANTAVGSVFDCKYARPAATGAYRQHPQHRQKSVGQYAVKKFAKKSDKSSKRFNKIKEFAQKAMKKNKEQKAMKKNKKVNKNASADTKTKKAGAQFEGPSKRAKKVKEFASKAVKANSKVSILAEPKNSTMNIEEPMMNAEENGAVDPMMNPEDDEAHDDDDMMMGSA